MQLISKNRFLNDIIYNNFASRRPFLYQLLKTYSGHKRRLTGPINVLYGGGHGNDNPAMAINIAKSHPSIYALLVLAMQEIKRKTQRNSSECLYSNNTHIIWTDKTQNIRITKAINYRCHHIYGFTNAKNNCTTINMCRWNIVNTIIAFMYNGIITNSAKQRFVRSFFIII